MDSSGNGGNKGKNKRKADSDLSSKLDRASPPQREALEGYDQAIESDPNDIEAHFNKGEALQRLDIYEEALESYDCAIELNPDEELKNSIFKNILSLVKTISLEQNLQKTCFQKLSQLIDASISHEVLLDVIQLILGPRISSEDQETPFIKFFIMEGNLKEDALQLLSDILTLRESNIIVSESLSAEEAPPSIPFGDCALMLLENMSRDEDYEARIASAETVIPVLNALKANNQIENLSSRGFALLVSLEEDKNPNVSSVIPALKNTLEEMNQTAATGGGGVVSQDLDIFAPTPRHAQEEAVEQNDSFSPEESLNLLSLEGANRSSSSEEANFVTQDNMDVPSDSQDDNDTPGLLGDEEGEVS